MINRVHGYVISRINGIPYLKRTGDHPENLYLSLLNNSGIVFSSRGLTSTS